MKARAPSEAPSSAHASGEEAGGEPTVAAAPDAELREVMRHPAVEHLPWSGVARVPGEPIPPRMLLAVRGVRLRPRADLRRAPAGAGHPDNAAAGDAGGPRRARVPARGPAP